MPSLRRRGRRATTVGAVGHRRAATQSAIRSRAAHEITGPTSEPSSIPSPTLSARAASVSGPISCSWASPTVTTTDPAMQRCPAAPNAEPMMPSTVLLDHGVGHHHHVVLGAAERLHALAGLGRALVDDLRHRGRADERDRVDPRVVEDPLDDLAAAVDEVDDARRQSERVELLEGDLLGQRHLLGGLEHERVAAGDREGQEPERDHRREVERRDRRAHADRLADRLGVDVRG